MLHWILIALAVVLILTAIVSQVANIKRLGDGKGTPSLFQLALPFVAGFLGFVSFVAGIVLLVLHYVLPLFQ